MIGTQRETEMSELLDTCVSVACPGCRAKFEVTLRDIRDERTVHCPAGHAIRLTEKGDGLGEVDRAIDDLHRAFGRLGRRS